MYQSTMYWNLKDLFPMEHVERWENHIEGRIDVTLYDRIMSIYEREKVDEFCEKWNYTWEYASHKEGANVNIELKFVSK